tara:strand:+ start:2296 stop:2961 length:666 start_codon:yes stop_codon:yes gene_type:complete
MGVSMDSNGNGDKGNVIPIETVKVKRHSSREKREELTRVLPGLKAKRKDTRAIKHKGYSQEITSKLLEAMAEGHTLTEACDLNGISRSTVYRWLRDNPSTFGTAYARAREMLAEHCFTQALEVPKALYAKAQAGEPLDGPSVGAARLLVDTLRWYSEKLNPAAYGAHSKQSIEVSGTMAVASVVVDSRSLSPAARDALRYALMAANAAPTIEHDEGEGVDE